LAGDHSLEMTEGKPRITRIAQAWEPQFAQFM